MTAMGVDRFVVTLRHAAENKTEERHWSKGDVMHSMAWLKRMNARGYDVLIRPDGEHGLVLLDGLSKAQLDILRQRGFGPAVAVDIDRGQYQAWVKLAMQPLAESVRSHAIYGLVRRMGGVSSADGLLSGFTNQQVQQAGGKHPFVLLKQYGGTVALAAPNYLAGVRHDLTKALERDHAAHLSR